MFDHQTLFVAIQLQICHLAVQSFPGFPAALEAGSNSLVVLSDLRDSAQSDKKPSPYVTCYH